MNSRLCDPLWQVTVEIWQRRCVNRGCTFMQGSTKQQFATLRSGRKSDSQLFFRAGHSFLCCIIEQEASSNSHFLSRRGIPHAWNTRDPRLHSVCVWRFGRSIVRTVSSLMIINRFLWLTFSPTLPSTARRCNWMKRHQSKQAEDNSMFDWRTREPLICATDGRARSWALARSSWRKRGLFHLSHLHYNELKCVEMVSLSLFHPSFSLSLCVCR